MNHYPEIQISGSSEFPKSENPEVRHSGNVQNHEQMLELGPYLTNRLSIKDFESTGSYQSNGTPPDPQNYHIKIQFEIGQKSNGPRRQKCILSYSVNGMALLPGAADKALMR